MTLTTAPTADDRARATIRAAWALARAADTTAEARRLVGQSRRRRNGHWAAWPRFFTLRGTVDGCRVRAWWSMGTLGGSPALLERAELLVQMGEEFSGEPGTAVIRADLGRSASAMLTVIRACDRVETVCFGPVGRPLRRHPPRASR